MRTGEPASEALQCNEIPPSRILVVDDDPAFQQLNTEILIGAGYDVDIATDATEAWERMQRVSYDLLITANNMAKVSGVELIAKVRLAGMTLPIVMAAVEPPGEDFGRYGWFQPVPILLKPYNAGDLLATVKAVCRESFRDDFPIMPTNKQMTLEWNKQTFRSLEEIWNTCQDKPDLSIEIHPLVERYEDIVHMAARDGIWPRTASNEKNKFCAALREVLSRLPQATFDRVDDEVRFLLDDPSLKMLALNAPAPPSRNLPDAPQIDTIIFFRRSMDLTPKALIALIAYEISQAFVVGEDSLEKEILATAQVREWGFGAELDCLESDKILLFGNTPAVASQPP